MKKALDALTVRPGPAITDYTARRTELTGTVVMRWVSKISDLVVQEDAADVYLDLPPSWRLVVWSLGAVAGGAAVTFTPAPAHLLVSDRPAAHPEPDAELALLQIMDPEVLRAPAADIPPGWLDAAAEVAVHPDTPPPLPPTGDLADRPVTWQQQADPARILLTVPTRDDAAGLADLAHRCLTQLLSGGSLVLARADDDLARIAEIERATRQD
ncbi:TIGR03089 family protein [Buchananella hordeovulneris]|uniref:TIGR03089 family protein n=1 Tax=Buchananella hordeovulneris TaxID=52770 RepID=UPI000F5E454F|nr:TIGR03089 family protein [Buchananella hordeovulneris]MDO5079800.1 TIGR03089 family protein [Buchananella hordeovulneris]RRD51694.1 hypothetical protein EII12_07715 [Buchananella hordeovulneris]